MAKHMYYGELFDKHRGDISGTWRTLKSIEGKTSDKTSFTEMNIDGSTVTDPVIISNTFCKYFTKIGKQYADQIPVATNHLHII